MPRLLYLLNINRMKGNLFLAGRFAASKANELEVERHLGYALLRNTNE